MVTRRLQLEVTSNSLAFIFSLTSDDLTAIGLFRAHALPEKMPSSSIFGSEAVEL